VWGGFIAFLNIVWYHLENGSADGILTIALNIYFFLLSNEVISTNSEDWMKKLSINCKCIAQCNIPESQKPQQLIISFQSTHEQVAWTLCADVLLKIFKRFKVHSQNKLMTHGELSSLTDNLQLKIIQRLLMSLSSNEFLHK